MSNDSLIPEITGRRKAFGLITIASVVLFLGLGVIVFEQDPHIPLLMGAMVGTGLAIIDGWKYNQIEKGMINAISLAMQAIMILMVIGMLIGSWLAGGIIQSMIYYGLDIVSPQFFFISALIICSIISITTGTSWATAGTVGVVLIAIAGALGINLGMAAGAIVSGAYFGDKLSPLSDTTNLAAGGAGVDVFTHIRSMLNTTIPNYILCMIIYVVLGFVFLQDAGGDISGIAALQSVLADSTNVTLLTLLAPAMVLLIVVLKIPALPGLLGAALVGVLMAVVLQGYTDFGDIIDILHYGYIFDGSALTNGEAASEFLFEQTLVDDGAIYAGMTYFDAAGEMTAAVSNLGHDPEAILEAEYLLSRGGLDSMMWTVSLIISAMIFGGVLEFSGMLASVVSMLEVFTRGPVSLVTTASLTAVIVNILSADQYISIILPIRMFKPRFKELNISPRVHSRVGDSAGTMTSALVPWNTCGATMSAFLGVGAASFAFWAFFNWLSVVFEILAAMFKYKFFKRDEDIAAGIVDPTL